MIKRSICSCGVGTRVFNWFSIMWFSLAIATTDIYLNTTPEKVARCGDNVTLTCEASSYKLLDVKSFSWTGQNKTLCDTMGNMDSAVGCQKETDGSLHKLTLRLFNVMPNHQGKYLCKFRSQVGVNYSTSFITVQDCLGSQNYLVNESVASCWFHGVYSRGEIHWFKGDENLTSLSSKEDFDQYGRYNILSSIKVQDSTGNQIYNCSLWITQLKKYVSFQEVVMVKHSRTSSGSKFKLQWLCMTLHVTLVTFILS
ncbi:uncharacterized protein LOC109514893 [Hippocampus comes]|uniref:uncharacterized protein LOC109514893 n=1 Tax=Hippocampus comes TaxID=109280 RepID=UPI00094F0794|nr:PREDICTED: uncharacterized protein LOC109514893 [Hippocampus comes]XP_019723888.1 PREDICTED: uncharacterized protein LOC109514893 [Hippocampus comes]